MAVDTYYYRLVLNRLLFIHEVTVNSILNSLFIFAIFVDEKDENVRLNVSV